MQDLNYKFELIGKDKIAKILKYPQKSVQDKFILLIDVNGRIPETSKVALRKLGLEGRTLCILNTVDGKVQQNFSII